MENNFYTDDFERLLKERSDEFRMYPSKRVWHSIYNDLHPGRKWPSIAMSMLLIIVLLFMGYMNNSTDPVSAQLAATVPGNNAAGNTGGNDHTAGIAFFPAGKNSKPGDNNNPVIAAVIRGQDNNSTTDPTVAATTNNRNLSSTTLIAGNRNRNRNTSHPSANRRTGNQPFVSFIPTGIAANNTMATSGNNRTARRRGRTINGAATRINVSNGDIAVAETTGSTRKNLSNSETPNTASTLMNEQDNTTAEQKNVTAKISGDNNEQLTNYPANSNSITGNTTTGTDIDKAAADAQATATVAPTQDNQKAWIENYAFYNKPKRKKWMDRMGLELYMTPTIGYRSLRGNAEYDPAASFAASQNAAPDVSSTVNHSPGLGLEAGIGFVYSAAKKIKLKGGLQMNLTNYNIHADKTSHPVLTTLLLNDVNTGKPYIESASSAYANSSSLQPVVLHNSSYQLSVPLGVALKLYGNSKLDWYAGASVLPTFVFGGKSYLLSSDRKNYVDDASFMRKWNISTGVETYLSYNFGNFNLQAGPQFRYQLYSTYNKQYTNTEKLYNVGLKIGILKNF